MYGYICICMVRFINPKRILGDMGKRKVTLSIEDKTYSDFQKYCNENALIVSKKIELLLKEVLKKIK